MSPILYNLDWAKPATMSSVLDKCIDRKDGGFVTLHSAGSAGSAHVPVIIIVMMMWVYNIQHILTPALAKHECQ